MAARTLKTFLLLLPPMLPVLPMQLNLPVLPLLPVLPVPPLLLHFFEMNIFFCV